MPALRRASMTAKGVWRELSASIASWYWVSITFMSEGAGLAYVVCPSVGCHGAFGCEVIGDGE